jgi:hypothetical protein
MKVLRPELAAVIGGEPLKPEYRPLRNEPYL